MSGFVIEITFRLRPLMMPVEITKVVEQVGDAPAIGEARS